MKSTAGDSQNLVKVRAYKSPLQAISNNESTTFKKLSYAKGAGFPPTSIAGKTSIELQRVAESCQSKECTSRRWEAIDNNEGTTFKHTPIPTQPNEPTQKISSSLIRSLLTLTDYGYIMPMYVVCSSFKRIVERYSNQVFYNRHMDIQKS
ncbi:hypothetical protein [Shewanella violacea]|uniref:Uncharacterized protein n=1 Tax=Shewanella violacea (strain JCM 10179 / CIP 106290 / LMG 19151 / DSS12) TaxID=637905 RepID=D4ZAN5_SHEVD|nr:hypothetical protein [Shewanella violacea]BAJ03080.1 hypothetical protein SVI_3109 [Shewanella violacea DSS12]